MLTLFNIGNVLFFAVYGLSLVVERMPDGRNYIPLLRG
jgi:hypothetical protein